MVQTAETIWRDFVTDGIPASGTQKPRKVEIREWGTWLEGFANALGANGGLVYTTKALLDADLAHPANTSAWVIGDSTAANNGIYRKSGGSGSGSWTRVADLPYSFIKASDTGAGTPNAIQATTSIPVPSADGAALIALNIFEANTGSPVTVAFNGGTALTIKTNSGNDVATGGLTAGMIVAGYVSGSTFRLLSDQASAAIVTAAEAAQTAAEAARDQALAAVPITYLPDRPMLAALDVAQNKIAALTEQYQEGVYHWREDDFAARIGADPYGAVYIKADAVAETIGAWVREWDGGPISASLFGARGRGEVGFDDQPFIQAAIEFTEDVFGIRGGANIGGLVTLPMGVFQISDRLRLTNRAGLAGCNGRATIIKPLTGFIANQMIVSANGTSSQFGSYIQDLYLDARGFNMDEVVLAEAWQETSGATRVLTQYDGQTRAGFHINHGYGGATHTMLRDVEFFSDSAHVSSSAIRLSQISSVGAFKLIIDGASMIGSPTNPLVTCIAVVNDTIVARGLHTEYSQTGIGMDGVGNLSVDTMTGSSNQTTDLIVLGSGFTGGWNLRNIMPNGATGQTFRDNSGRYRNIPASEGALVSHHGPHSDFFVSAGSNINDVTGNGTGYNIVFNTEAYDRHGEVVDGLFTAKKTGTYQFSANIEMNVPTGSTSTTLLLVTSNRTILLWRGSVNNIRNTSNNVVIGGSASVDLDAGDTARLQIVIGGIGTDTADVLAGSSFSGKWLAS